MDFQGANVQNTYSKAVITTNTIPKYITMLPKILCKAPKITIEKRMMPIVEIVSVNLPILCRKVRNRLYMRGLEAPYL